MNDISVIDNVKIETDENGNQHFTVVEQDNSKIKRSEEEKSWFQRLSDWYGSLFVKPYVKCKDLNNGEDTHSKNKPKPAIEVGVKISF